MIMDTAGQVERFQKRLERAATAADGWVAIAAAGQGARRRDSGR